MGRRGAAEIIRAGKSLLQIDTILKLPLRPNYLMHHHNYHQDPNLPYVLDIDINFLFRLFFTFFVCKKLADGPLISIIAVCFTVDQFIV